ncbi:MAG: rhodanese-like domain-containing protein [Bacteroidota bacterium]
MTSSLMRTQKQFARFFKGLLMIALMCGMVACSSAEESKPKDTPTAQTPPPEPEKEKGKIKDINIETFVEVMNSTKDLQILDVRRPDEVAEGVIEGAIHLNVLEDDFGKKANATLKKDQPIAVICKSGGRSVRASNTLLGFGFTQIYNIIDGMDGWKEAGKPLAKLEE